MVRAQSSGREGVWLGAGPVGVEGQRRAVCLDSVWASMEEPSVPTFHLNQIFSLLFNIESRKNEKKVWHQGKEKVHFYKNHRSGVYSFLVPLNQKGLFLLLLLHVPGLIVHDFIQNIIANFLFSQNESK